VNVLSGPEEFFPNACAPARVVLRAAAPFGSLLLKTGRRFGAVRLHSQAAPIDLAMQQIQCVEVTCGSMLSKKGLRSLANRDSGG
jgi:hypothetical protein